jgi:methylthioribulose-1-phosphate dehydratase
LIAVAAEFIVSIPMGLESAHFDAIAAELVQLGSRCHARGSALATSGNFSARLDESSIAITASGRDKGALAATDILVIGLDGQLLPGSRGQPSAEAPLHCQLYRKLPAIGAVAHTHGRAATVLSRRTRPGEHVEVEGYEMAKALPGVSTHEQVIRLPVFANTQDVARLASEVTTYMGAHGPVHGYLIAGHGLYTWGSTVAEVGRHVEALEFLLECELWSRGLP